MKNVVVDANMIQSYEKLHAYEKEKHVRRWDQTRLVVVADDSTGKPQLTMRKLTFWENLKHDLPFGFGPASKRSIKNVMTALDGTISGTVQQILKIPRPSGQAPVIEAPPAQQAGAPKAPKTLADLGPLLRAAAAAGSTETVKSLLQEIKGISEDTLYLDTKDVQVQLNQALQMASKHGHREVVKMLMLNRANPYTKQPDDEKTPLMYGVEAGNESVLDKLISPNAGSRDRAHSPHKTDPLEAYEALKQLNKTIPINKWSNERLMLVHVLCNFPKCDSKKYNEMIQTMCREANDCLLSVYALANSYDAYIDPTYLGAAEKMQETIIHTLITSDKLDTMKLLKPHISIGQMGTFLDTARKSGNSQIITFLLESGATRYVKEYGQELVDAAKVAFMNAVKQGQVEVVQAMFSAVPRFPTMKELFLQLKDANGKTALLIAQERLEQVEGDAQKALYQQLKTILSPQPQ